MMTMVDCTVRSEIELLNNSSLLWAPLDLCWIICCWVLTVSMSFVMVEEEKYNVSAT